MTIPHRGKLGRQFFAILLIVATLLPSQFQPVIAQSVLRAQTNTDIPCDESPFGSVLPVGEEDEAFLSVRNADNVDPGRLNPYRLNLDPSTGHLNAEFVSDLSTEPTGISSLAGVAADLDGDGKSEYVEGFTNASAKYELLVRKNGHEPQTHTEEWLSHINRSMAAGDILGLRTRQQEVVVASRGGDGVLNVAVFSGTVDGGNVGAPIALWRGSLNGRLNAGKINVAVGNLNNNRFADIVVSLEESDQQQIQLIALEYEANFQSGSGGDFSQNLHERASYRFQASPSKDIRMKLADLSGSGQDFVVVARQRQPNPPLIIVQAFALVISQGIPQFVEQGTLPFQNDASSFDLATGDLRGDGRDEIVVGYGANVGDTKGPLNVVTLGWSAPPGTTPAITELDRWQDSADDRDRTNYLALAVGDLNKDTHNEVVAAFKDANAFGFQTLYLTPDQNQHLQLADWSRQDSTINARPAIDMADWDNDSLLAYLGDKCARVVDGIITGGNFVPPYWQNIQGDQNRGGSIGRSVTQEQGTENSLTYHRADTSSLYLGVGVGIEAGVFEFNASVKIKASQELATSNSQTGSVMTTTVTTVGQSWSNDALVYEPAEYDCYSYRLGITETLLPADQAQLRFCQYQYAPGSTVPLEASELNSWDSNFGGKPEYTPVVRDWSTLTLFRGAFTDQSSNAATAKFAVDSEIVNGSYNNPKLAQTLVESNPWWQVDLGESKKIDKIRLWDPKGDLTNFYVFVSNTDFRSIPGGNNPANLLNRSDVQHYTLADLGNGFVMTDTAGYVATFLTLNDQLNPISGRYVRVQRPDTAALTLAEVQVFGPNHVEPDRYPLDVRDTTPNDGMFEVRLYNPYHVSSNDTYVWTKTRGNLLWYDPQNSLLSTLTIGRGNTSRDWSLSKAVGIGNSQSHEIDNSTSVGAEIESEAGAGIKVLAGGGVESTDGLASEVIQSTSWSNEFNMGGSMQGFPTTFDGPAYAWVDNCRYRFIPYSYEVTETANQGYNQRFSVLDYTVPDDGHASDLHRTSSAIAACRNGNLTNTTPVATNDLATILPSQPITIQVLANDLGNQLNITNAGPAQHGTVTHTDREITYTPENGFQGVDSFFYTMESNQDNEGEGLMATETITGNSAITASVTITVSAPVTVPSLVPLYMPLLHH